MNPCILLEANVQPQNDKGVRWKSAIYDYRHMIEAQDQILSDAVQLHKEYTRSPLVFTLNTEARDMDMTTAGKAAEQVVYEPGKPIFLRQDEKLAKGPLPEMSEVSLRLLDLFNTYNTTILLNPVTMGRLPAGTSGVGFEAARQTAEQNLDPLAKGVIRAVKHWVKLAFRSVPRLAER